MESLYSSNHIENDSIKDLAISITKLITLKSFSINLRYFLVNIFYSNNYAGAEGVKYLA